MGFKAIFACFVDLDFELDVNLKKKVYLKVTLL